MVDRKLIAVIKKGGVGVMPTDTLYGLVGTALSQKTVERIYRIRERGKKRPVIVLISSLWDLALFGVKPTAQAKKFLGKVWPGPYSVILPCPGRHFAYIHRGVGSIAFRLPEPKWLRDLLRATGPLVAPSANPEGKPPAKTIAEAKKYFGEKIDFYVRGAVHEAPSTLVEVRR